MNNSNPTVKPKIAVVMSTYNGAVYLSTQIDCILNQKDVNVDLFIRDDGSEDATLAILKQYENQNNNVHVTIGKKNLGYAQSFLLELSLVTGFQYYAFSDQDDFWQPDKLISAIKMIEKSNKPCLYYSNLTSTDSNLKPIKTTRLQRRKQTLESVTMRRSIAGCTMVFNNKLKELICRQSFPSELKGLGHDSFIVSLTYSVGADIFFDQDVHIYYRQHGDNTSGSSGGIINRIKKEKKLWMRLKGQESKLAAFLLDHYSDCLTKDGTKILTEIEKSKHSFGQRMKIFFSPRYSTGIFALTFVGKFKVLLNRL